MFERDIYTIHSTYREDMRIKGFQFGKGEKSACIVGAARGNEIQQMYICSQLVKTLRELENNGCISAGKQILVIPTINAYSVNISRRFFGVKEADINRSFPGIRAPCAYDGDRLSEYVVGESVRTSLCGGAQAGTHRYQDTEL